jgi:hypothetical protein
MHKVKPTKKTHKRDVFYLEHGFTCSPTLTPKGAKIPTVPSGTDQPFQMDLLKHYRPIHTDAQSPSEQTLLTAPGYGILSDEESRHSGEFEADNKFCGSNICESLMRDGG